MTDRTARFEGRVVIVTGAAGGIGRATALRLAGEGAAVVAVDLPRSDLAGTVAAVTDAGGEITTVTADVRSSDDVAGYVAAAQDTYGRLDVLCNNAGVEGVIRPLADYSTEDFEQVMAVNVRGVWLGIKHAGPAIAAGGGGVIVNMASLAGLTGAAGLGPYVASKHAVIGLTKSAALEFADRGVRVVAVAPAPVDTRMVHTIAAGFNPANPDAARERMVGRVPMRRFGTPEDIAGVVSFLASDDAAYMTGSAVLVDGGWRAGN